MDRRSLDIPALISYLSWPGWIIAVLIRDKTDLFATHHINQSLILNILSVIAGFAGRLPVAGGLISLVLSFAVLVLWIMGIIRAVMWDDRPLPLIGGIHIFG
ncbi:MAG: hypothetical protein IKI38_00320 [Mogibacterium sp.]|nr:hypothetical protein [Mogibacterium sp.]